MRFEAIRWCSTHGQTSDLGGNAVHCRHPTHCFTKSHDKTCLSVYQHLFKLGCAHLGPNRVLSFLKTLKSCWCTPHGGSGSSLHLKSWDPAITARRVAQPQSPHVISCRLVPSRSHLEELFFKVGEDVPFCTFPKTLGLT